METGPTGQILGPAQKLVEMAPSPRQGNAVIPSQPMMAKIVEMMIGGKLNASWGSVQVKKLTGMVLKVNLKMSYHSGWRLVHMGRGGWLL